MNRATLFIFLFFDFAISVYSANPAIDSTINVEKIRPRGERYETTVPDTLDLAERAKLAVNCMLGNVEPEKQYCVYQLFSFSNEARSAGLTWNLQSKNIRALPMLREITGSEEGMDLEAAIMRNTLEQIGEDGIAYFPIDGDNVPKGTSHPLIDGLIGLAMTEWYIRDQQPEWKEWIKSVSSGLQKMATVRQNRAYYPLECGYKPNGEWVWAGWRQAVTPYTPPEEPVLDYQGGEGTVKFDNAIPMHAMVMDYKLNQTSNSLGMAKKIAAFLLKPSFWQTNPAYATPGWEHGQFVGHFHGNIQSYWALLDLAEAADDDQLRQFVRETYDHGRRSGLTRMGWFPAWSAPELSDRPDIHSAWAEGCGVANMVALAVKLSETGLGDYWDDVDYFTRNQLAEQQYIDRDLIAKLAGNKPEHDKLINRFIGGFGGARPTSNNPEMYGCCSANCSMALYYAWNGITSFQNGIAKVNLFLNRASAWMDIDSYLPYEGKVVLHNKKARTVWVRIPGWLNPDSISCTVNNAEANPILLEHNLIFDGLKEGDRIELNFKVPEQTSKQIIHRTEYTITWRGSTIVDITPRENDPKRYPIYRRQALRAERAPMHQISRFVSTKTHRYM